MDHDWMFMREDMVEGTVTWRCVRCDGTRSMWMEDGAPPSGSWALAGDRYVRCGEAVVAEVLES